MSLLLREIGTPIISRRGKFTYLTDFDVFKQRIWNLFNTQLGSVTMFPNYGFDSLGIKNMNPNDIERGLYSFTLNALNPDYVEGLAEILSIVVKYEDQKGYIDIILLSDYGQRYQSRFEVNVNEL